MKNGGKVIAVLLMFLCITATSHATSNTQEIKRPGTQKQLISALKDKDAGLIIIRPSKATSFKIGKKSYKKELVIYQKNTTLINEGKFNCCEIFVTNKKEVKKAIKFIEAYRGNSSSVENILHIVNATGNIEIPKYNFKGKFSLVVEDSDCNISNQATWDNIELRGSGANGFSEFASGNDIEVTGDTAKIVISTEASVKSIWYNQSAKKQHNKTLVNNLEVNGSIEEIILESSRDLYLTGEACENGKEAVLKLTGEDVSVYMQGERLFFGRDDRLVSEAEKRKRDFDEDGQNSEISTGNGDVSYNKSSEAGENSSADKKDSYTYKAYQVKSADGTESTVYGYFDEAAAYQLYLKVNEIRSSSGLEPLRWDSSTLSSVESRTVELACSFRQERPDGSPGTSIFGSKSGYEMSGGIVFGGYKTAEEILSRWSAYQTSCANIKNPDYNKMIAGCMRVKEESTPQGFRYYWVVYLGKDVEEDTRDYKEYSIKISDGSTVKVYGYLDQEMSYQVYLKVNELRASLGLGTLEWDGQMVSCAEIRAAELIYSYSHTRPDGFSFASIVKASGITECMVGENIAAGYKNVDAVMNGWTNSPGHYANMTHKSYNKMGVACIVARDDTDKHGMRYYWVQLFRRG